MIFATPAWAAGQLISAVDDSLGADLAAIPYSSSITVTMGYSQEQLRALPPGFGFLVPRSEHRRMLACTFVHNKFPHRAPDGKGLLRCFLGGATDEAALDLSDGEVEKIVRRELKEHLAARHGAALHPGLSLAPRHGPVQRRPSRSRRSH